MKEKKAKEANKEKSSAKSKFSFYNGLTFSAWLLTIMVIASELFAPFKDLLKTLFTHHWVGKGVIITVAFILFGFLLREKESIGSMSSEKAAWYSTLASLIVILLFFIIEFLK